ncbi:MAG: SpoIIE family protein phosphatase [Oligoflexia bacterium]|nr:SpoIIE family protein phosphatase [Oligoflexia bacterium]
MEQQQFRIRFSVGSKLLIIVGTFLFLTIVFLSVSAVFLMTDDKQAYTFQTKSIEAELAGRNFLKVVEHDSDNLRLSLAGVDLNQPADHFKEGSQYGDALKSLVLSQSDLSGVGIGQLNDHTGEINLVAFSIQPELTQKSSAPESLAAVKAELTPDWMNTVLADLMRTGIGFVNLSKAGRSPLLAILIVDRSVSPGHSGVPFAVGLLPLDKISSEFADLDLTIATKSGWLLLDSSPVELFERPNIAQDPLFLAALSNPVQTGTLDYQSAKGRFLGGYSKPGFDLVVLTRANWKQAMRASYALTEKFILLGCMAVGLGIIFVIFFSKSLTAPINRLYEATREVAAGNFDIDIRPSERDEIGALTSSFNVMSSKVRELLKDSVDKAILEKEIDIASTVQRTLIPSNSFDGNGVQIRAQYQSASSCGGDWWGQFLIDGKLVVGIADATGHGLSSALITASARSCFSMIQRMVEQDPTIAISPATMLDYANRVIFDCANGNIMMTFFMAVIDLNAGQMVYANAAHNPPWLMKRGESGYKLNSLVSTGMRLGEGLEIAEPLQDKSIDIGAGDVLFLYTDGLTEGKNLADEMFGKKRVRKLVEANVAAGPDSVISAIMGDFMAHNEGKALDDDVTVIAMSFGG